MSNVGTCVPFKFVSLISQDVPNNGVVFRLTNKACYMEGRFHGNPAHSVWENSFRMAVYYAAYVWKALVDFAVNKALLISLLGVWINYNDLFSKYQHVIVTSVEESVL